MARSRKLAAGALWILLAGGTIPLGPAGALPTQDQVETLPLTGDFELVSGFNANGIEVTPDGKGLLVIQSATATLFRVDPTTGVATAVDLGGVPLTNGDGLLVAAGISGHDQPFGGDPEWVARVRGTQVHDRSGVVHWGSLIDGTADSRHRRSRRTGNSARAASTTDGSTSQYVTPSLPSASASTLPHGSTTLLLPRS